MPTSAEADQAARRTPPATAWYLCFTKPRQEAFAQAKLQEQGYITFLPQLLKWARVGGSWQQRAQVMFPRYLFVRPADNRQALGPVRSTPGVSHLVRFGPALATMSDARLGGVRQLCDALASTLPDQPFQPGDHVIFAEGPLKGARGIVSSVAQQRVSVMLTLLGHAHQLQAPARELVAA